MPSIEKTNSANFAKNRPILSSPCGRADPADDEQHQDREGVDEHPHLDERPPDAPEVHPEPAALVDRVGEQEEEEADRRADQHRGDREERAARVPAQAGQQGQRRGRGEGRGQRQPGEEDRHRCNPPTA